MAALTRIGNRSLQCITNRRKFQVIIINGRENEVTTAIIRHITCSGVGLGLFYRLGDVS